MSSRVLIVEDEEQMRVILHDNLEYEGYGVIQAQTGEEGLALAFRERPDVMLIDVMLPNMDGYEVCRKIRAAGLSMPIIMITARNTDIDRITGLEFGADDYLGKPFNVRELIARIKAQLRRSERARHPDVFTFGNIVIDVVKREVVRGSRPVNMSAREFDLLWYLVTHQDQLISRERLLSEVWGYSNVSLTRTVDNFIAKLRRKIEPDERVSRHILTVHGAGYRFVA